MTPRPLPHGTTSSPRRRSAARAHAVVLLLLASFATVLLAAPDAPAAPPPASGHAAGITAATVEAHSARQRHCAPARGLLHSRRSMRATQRRILCLMNRVRARFGLPRLRPNRCLHRVAARHSRDMVRRRYFAHITPNGWDPGARARASGYVPRRASWVVGENIAWGVSYAARPRFVVRSWMHSPSHRRNILNPRFRDAGIGVARGTPGGGFRHLRLRATFSAEFGAAGGRTRCSRR
jgi:uncharacterized protein YkwD